MQAFRYLYALVYQFIWIELKKKCPQNVATKLKGEGGG